MQESVKCDLCGVDDCEQLVAKGGTYYVRCRECGFVYVNPRLTDPAAANQDAVDARRDEYISHCYSGRKQRDYAKLLRGFARYRSGNRLVEIGSNVGGFIYRAREMGWEPLGVEPVAACVEYAREKHGLTCICGVLEEAGIEADSTDVIFSNSVFEHLASPTTVLGEAARILRPGGVIFTKTVNVDSYTFAHVGVDWSLLSPLAHLSLFTAQTLPEFCRKAGLEVVSVRSSGVRMAKTGNPTLSRVRKGVLSALARFTRKGDRLMVLARKPV